MIDSQELTSRISEILDTEKGLEIEILKVSQFTDIADAMVVATGTSKRHVTAMAEALIEELSKFGHKPHGIEGMEHGEWVLVDFLDVIVHLMRENTREFYNLSDLWNKSLLKEERMNTLGVDEPSA